MTSFILYPQPELPAVHGHDWNTLGRDIEGELGKRWLDRFGGFDYGAMTVWLMRGFGLPNLRAYDTFKHSFCWGLETSEGYVISIEPGLVRIDPAEYAAAQEERQGNQWSKQDFRNHMAAHSVIGVQPLRAEVEPLSEAMINGWLDQFARPIYVRDVGGTVLGPISQTDWATDEGPGDDSVLDGGAELADTPTRPT